MEMEINFCRVNKRGQITHVAGVIPTADNPNPECTPETIKWCPVSKSELSNDFGVVWELRNAIELFNAFNWGLPPKPTAERPVDFDNVRQIMNPYGGGTHTCKCNGMARVFIESMLAFPRFETPDGMIELGGVDYLTASTNAGCDKAKAAGAADDLKSVDEMLADAERRECGFARKVAAFNAYVDWVGVHTGCGGAAQCVVLAVDRLAGALCECGIRQTAHVEWAAGEVEKALAEMCRALGDAENAGAKAKNTNKTLARVESKIDGIRADVQDVRAGVDTTESGVEYLVEEEQRKSASRKQRGVESYLNGEGKRDRERAKRDLEIALKRVHDMVASKHCTVLDACRYVCKNFDALTNKKTRDGKPANPWQLYGADGKPMKPETLAKHYRERYGTVKKRKADKLHENFNEIMGGR